jgi:putative acetyltransferase
MHIRAELPNDAEAIAQVTIRAFQNAPHTDHTEQFIVRELRAANSLTVSLVAELHGQIVGHVAVSPVTISDGSPHWFGLGPISVAPEFQGQGVGSELMNAAVSALHELSAQGCVLLGDPSYYRHFGFHPVPGLMLPGVPAEYFQAMPIRGLLPQGEVKYHEAFNAKA